MSNSSNSHKPTTMLCTRGELVYWFREDYGIGEDAVAKLIENDTIKGKALPGTTRKRYSPQQIERDVLSGLVEQNGHKDSA